ncbi:MAG: DUF3108 domain-containing protein [Burkholderiales bacterium]|nr:DUF3108 domain-containing protein [Burkholderiales bacterium]
MRTRFRSAFWVCLAGSLLFHASLLSHLPILTSLPEPEMPVLMAELKRIEPAPPPAVQTKQRAPAPRPAARPTVTPRAAPAPRPVLEPAAALAPPPTREDTAEVPDPSPSAEAADPSSPAAAVPVAETPAETPVEPPPVAAAPPEPAAPSVAEPQLPEAGTMTYLLYFGQDKFSIGRSVWTWSIDRSSYRLTSFSETTGLLGFFRPYQYAYVSEGQVDAQGLRPELFLVRRGRAGERQASARFDWDKRELTFGPVSAPHTIALQPGTYDFLSLIYQLARTQLVPGRMRFTITTGTKVNSYTLEVGAEEALELPIGTVRAIPVKQVRIPGEESMELWFSTAQRLLPVRIRFLDREGNMSVEQLANGIAANGR